MKQKRKNLLTSIALLSIFVALTAVYFVAAYFVDDVIIQRWIYIAIALVMFGCVVAAIANIFAVTAIRSSREALHNTLRNDMRPILSYLGRVLTKTESEQPRAEAVINNLLMSPKESNNLKMSLDGSHNAIIPYEEVVEDESDDPIVLIRPFIFANYGKSIAVALTISLDDKIISHRSDYIIEPNSKIQLEVNDTVRFNKNMKYFTMSYFDVYGNEYQVRLDGMVEYAKDESRGLERDVYFYYVEGFSEIVE